MPQLKLTVEGVALPRRQGGGDIVICPVIMEPRPDPDAVPLRQQPLGEIQGQVLIRPIGEDRLPALLKYRLRGKDRNRGDKGAVQKDVRRVCRVKLVSPVIHRQPGIRIKELFRQVTVPRGIDADGNLPASVVAVHIFRVEVFPARGGGADPGGKAHEAIDFPFGFFGLRQSREPALRLAAPRGVDQEGGAPVLCQEASRDAAFPPIFVGEVRRPPVPVLLGGDVRPVHPRRVFSCFPIFAACAPVFLQGLGHGLPVEGFGVREKDLDAVEEKAVSVVGKAPADLRGAGAEFRREGDLPVGADGADVSLRIRESPVYFFRAHAPADGPHREVRPWRAKRR